MRGRAIIIKQGNELEKWISLMDYLWINNRELWNFVEINVFEYDEKGENIIQYFKLNEA